MFIRTQSSSSSSEDRRGVAARAFCEPEAGSDAILFPPPPSVTTASSKKNKPSLSNTKAMTDGGGGGSAAVGYRPIDTCATADSHSVGGQPSASLRRCSRRGGQNCTSSTVLHTSTWHTSRHARFVCRRRRRSIRPRVIISFVLFVPHFDFRLTLTPVINWTFFFLQKLITRRNRCFISHNKFHLFLYGGGGVERDHIIILSIVFK